MAISAADAVIDSDAFLPSRDGVLSREVVFGRQAPLELEVGCGNGHFLTGLARSCPERDFIGVDIRYRRIAKSCSKADRLALSNVRFLLADAYRILGSFLPVASVRTLYVNFPDPWPKYKHRKFRLNTAGFVELLARVLEPGGVLWWVCDHYPQIVDVVGLCRELEKKGILRNRFATDGFSVSCPDYPETLYEKKWRASGRPIFYVCFEKSGEEIPFTASRLLPV